MKINSSKSQLMVFGFSRKFVFEPHLFLDEQELEVVSETKLLGIHMTSDCRWTKNTDNIVSKANQKLWFPQRLKKVGASVETLVEMYNLFVRPSLEYAAPLWTSSLSKTDIYRIEKIQRRATDLIIGRNNLSYLDRMTELQMISLEQRRWSLTSKFAVKLSQDPEFKSLLPLKPFTGTRSKSKYIEIKANTKRFQVSPLLTYAKILNQIEVQWRISPGV